MNAAAALSLLPVSICRPSKSNSMKGDGCRGGFRVFAVFGEEDSLGKRSTWGAIFHVEDPRPIVPLSKGKFLDVNQALEFARFDIQYCDWKARQDLPSIIVNPDSRLHPNPLVLHPDGQGTRLGFLSSLHIRSFSNQISTALIPLKPI